MTEPNFRIKKIKIIDQWAEYFLINGYRFQNCLFTKFSYVTEEEVLNVLYEKFNPLGECYIISFDGISISKYLSYNQEETKEIDFTNFFPFNRFKINGSYEKSLVHIDTFFLLKKNFLFNYKSELEEPNSIIYSMYMYHDLSGFTLKMYASKTSISNEEYTKVLDFICCFIREREFDINKTAEVDIITPLDKCGATYLQLSIGENMKMLSFTTSGIPCSILLWGLSDFRKKRLGE